MKLKDIKLRGEYREFPPDTGDLESSFSRLIQLQPVIVNEKDELVCGYRRYLAAKSMSKTGVEAHVVNTGGSHITELMIQHDENERRIGFHWAEIARRRATLHFYFALEFAGVIAPDTVLDYEEAATLYVKSGKLTWTEEETATKLGVSQKTISQALKVALLIHQDPSLVALTSAEAAISGGSGGKAQDETLGEAVSKAVSRLDRKYGEAEVDHAIKQYRAGAGVIR